MSAPSAELWQLVIPYLHRSIPTPLSAPPRSAIRQGDLASLARTCKLFHQIATPLIYADIITDDLPSLLDPSAARRSNLAHTKTLRIEYGLQGQGPAYSEVCADSPSERREAWDESGPTEERRTEIRVAEAREEIRTLTAFFDNSPSLSHFMPNVETIIVGSIYGPDIELWEPIVNYGVKAEHEQSPLRTCMRRFADFIRGSAVRQICVRDVKGPLSVQRYTVSDIGTPHTTLHFGHLEETRVSLRCGSPIRWMLDGPPDQDWAGILPMLGRHLKLLHQIRRTTPAEAVPVDLLITCSTTHSSRPQFDAHHMLFHHHPKRSRLKKYWGNVSPDLQVARVAQLEKVVQRDFDTQFVRTRMKEDDKVRWESCVDAEPCRACGVRPPQ